MALPLHIGPDLLDLLTERVEATKPADLCSHVSRVDGWSLEVDPASPHVGRWVHGDPSCRKPAYA